MAKYSETDRIFIRLLREEMGRPWETAKANILAKLPADLDPSQLAKYVDDSPRPHIHINAYGVEPRFYAHRESRRLLEFYPSK